MATKAELQELCVRVAEEYLDEHDVSQFFAAEYDEVSAVKAGSDVPILSGVLVDPDREFPLALCHVSIDFAVYVESEPLRAGLATSPLTYAEPDLSIDEDPVRLPVLAAEVVGDDYTQKHPISTSEMEFPQEESPYIFRTDLVWLPRVSFGVLPTTLLISDYPSAFVPARENVSMSIAADGGVEEESIREALRDELAFTVYRASKRRIGEGPYE